MLYRSGEDYKNAKHKSLAFFGMSGLGKSRLSAKLAKTGEWFHYSVDYRIGTHYLAEPVKLALECEVIKLPTLQALLRSGLISIKPKLDFSKLGILSWYLGKPGDVALGGRAFEDYQRRQDLHLAAEIAAMGDILDFQEKAWKLYARPHFAVDCSGSLCEILGPDIAQSEVMKNLAQNALPVWIKNTDQHKQALIERFKKAPKPMYYRKAFLKNLWVEYQTRSQRDATQIDPDAFAIFGFERLLDARSPRYADMARHFGVVLDADDLWDMADMAQLDDLIAHAIDQKMAQDEVF